MKKISVIGIISLLLISVIYVECRVTKTTDPRGESYAGSAACVKCHSKIAGSYLHTAHYVASIPADLSTVHGNFNKNRNTFTPGPNQKIVMEKRNNGLFQTYYADGKIKESQKFDVVMGGVKGESYLYWKGKSLYQLPVSYYTNSDEWLLSPRFDPRTINFNRAINSRCLECHASYISDDQDANSGLSSVEQFDKSSLIYSVDCERCHGPAAEHVAFQTKNPGLKTARFITTYASLSRARKMDLCGTCHSGNKSEVLKPTFGFKPGDTLANFKLPGFVSSNQSAATDVHGNQMQLLESSKCFISSKMDCASCHNVHQNERDNVFLYTLKCLACHQTVSHSFRKTNTLANNEFVRANCIKCHMPAIASAAITSAASNRSVSKEILVHTHLITVYAAESKRILSLLNAQKH